MYLLSCAGPTLTPTKKLSGHGTTHCTNGIIIQRVVQPSGDARSGPRAQTTSTREYKRDQSLLGPARLSHTLLERDAVLATWLSVMNT